ncbi:MAG: hypothetical protein QM809_03395 [Gordonia sp. (in: high G+C Gram-positive bacteria)]|uniref:hypothetical protein n=1 Tax=Gordonia sp. (in: high G+C Gram-positive bacteria) TaxID=84139 RepID=UPI0039E51BB4
MLSPFTRSIAVGAVTAAALTGAAILAPDASAKVSEGRYRSTTVLFGSTTRSYVAVDGSTLTSYGPFGPQRFRIVATPGGGFVDAHGARYTLNRRAGGGYAGPVHLGPVVVGHTELRPTVH